MSIYEVTPQGVKARSPLDNKIVNDSLNELLQVVARYVSTHKEKKEFVKGFLQAFSDTKGELVLGLDPTFVELHRVLGDTWEVLYNEHGKAHGYDPVAMVAFHYVMESVRVMKAKMDITYDIIDQVLRNTPPDLQVQMVSWAWCENQLSVAVPAADAKDRESAVTFGITAKFLTGELDLEELLVMNRALMSYLHRHHNYPQFHWVVMKNCAPVEEEARVNLQDYLKSNAMLGFERAIMGAAGVGMVPGNKDAEAIARFLAKLFETSSWCRDDMFNYMLDFNPLYSQTVFATLLGYYKQTKKDKWLVYTNVPAFCREVSQTLLGLRSQIAEQRRILAASKAA